MKTVWITLPILALVAFVIGGALLRKPVARHTLNVVVALYLLVYLVATAALGLFWVARMELPAFDLHYLFGYCLMALAAWHLWFQRPVLSAFFRRLSPPALLTPDRRQWRRGVRIAFWVVVLAVLATLAMWITIEFVRPRPVVILPMIMKWNPHPQRIWIQIDRQKLAAADYLHRESALTRLSVMRPKPFAGERPGEFKAWPGKPWVSLPEARRSVSVAERVEAKTLSLQELADLLFYSYGVTETRRYPGGVLHLRAAASAGALYPTELYVLARAVEGLEPALYYYHAARHALARIAGGEVAEQVARATTQPDAVRTAPAVLIFSAVFDRSVWKYNVRAYRYVTLDAGHVAGNLAAAAGALGWPLRWVSRFDDEQLTRALGADPQQEGALLMALVGLTPAEETQLPACGPLPAPREPGKVELTRLSHQLTSWRWTEGEPHPLPARVLADERWGKPEPMPLPAAAAAGRDVFAVIRARRSVREYADRPIPQQELAGLLADTVRWPADLAGSELLRLYVVVRKVDGIGAGVYWYRPTKRALQAVARGDFSAKLYTACLSQEMLARAAVVLAWTIDMERVGQRDGERDYRHACLAAGLGGENAYLAAVGRGLGICGVGAFFDAEVDAVLGTTDTPHRALYLLAVGPRD